MLNSVPTLADLAIAQQPDNVPPDVWVLPRATRGDELLSDMARWVLKTFELPQSSTDESGRHTVAAVTDEPSLEHQEEVSQLAEGTVPVGGRHSAYSEEARAGYTLHVFPYDDDYAPDRYHMAVAVRDGMESRAAELVRLAGTNALRLTIDNGTEDGVHLLALDLDRYSGDRRRYQAEEAMRMVGPRAILAGGFSATHKRGLLPRSLQLVRPALGGLARVLPARRPASAVKAGPAAGGRWIDDLLNLADMTNGRMMRALGAAGFSDASQDFAPTQHLREGIDVQTHHLLYRGGLVVVQPTQVRPTRSSGNERIDAVFYLAM